MWNWIGGIALVCLAAGVSAAPESGVQTQHFDPEVAPQDDFYRHVNGKWLAETEIPADKSAYSAFTEIADRTEQQLRRLIEAAASAEARPGSPAQKIGDMYRSFMDKSRADALGLQALQADLRQIDRLSSHAGIADLMAALERIGVDSLIGGWVGRDKKQPDRYTVYMYQSGLGLPDRDYYLEDTDRFRQLRSDYQDYLGRLLRKAGTIDADRYAQQILALEHRIAQAQWTRVQSRDAQKTYNPVSLEKINDAMGGWQARRYLQQVGVHSIDQVIVYQPSFFADLGDILRETPIDVWREYFRARLISTYAPYLSQDLVDLHFDFYRRKLSGVDEARPRWKRAVATVEDGLGELLGQLYVAEHFPPRAKQRMQAMVENLIQAYAISIRELDWMGDATRAQALRKLAAFTPKIGYPDEWKDYSALSVAPDDLVGRVAEQLGGPGVPGEDLPVGGQREQGA